MPSLPNIPVEVWRHIFIQVVRVPGLLLTDPIDPFSPVQEADLFKSKDFHTQLSLLLVCKSWNALAIELVYEHIRFVSSCQLHRIASSLEKYKRCRGTRCLGACTRRIDVSIQNPDEKDMANLARVLRCTPNLRIFTNSNSSPMTYPVGSATISPPLQTSSQVIQAFLSTSAPSLRRLEWTCNECPSWDDLVSLLRSARGLRSLALPNIYGSHSKKPPRQRLTLPNLRTLILGDGLSFSHASLGNVPLNALLSMLSHSPDQLPRLERLEGFSPFSPAFLNTHGHKIRTVRTVAYTPLLSDIIAKCPNLETFITIFPQQHLHRLRHSSLKRIGIFPISEHEVGVPMPIFQAYVMKPLEDLMCQIEKSDLPSLAQIRLRDVGTLASVGDFPQSLKGWQDHWGSRGVLFDDKDGRLFHAVTLA